MPRYSEPVSYGRDLAAEGLSSSDAQDAIQGRFTTLPDQEEALLAYYSAMEYHSRKA